MGLILSLHAGTAVAAPEDTFDPVLRLLMDKSLAVEAAPAPAAAAPGLLRRVQDRASSMVVAALGFVGVPYAPGGTSADGGFDCSGFTRHVFETSLGLVLPRKVDDQAAAPGLVAVGRDELRPGDLVFFNTLRRTFSHVGIYIGDNRFVHAPRSGKAIRTESMGFAYWSERFTGARRVSAEVPAADRSVAAKAEAVPPGP
jgi:cell wall-associated NlpC family hydrolase